MKKILVIDNEPLANHGGVIDDAADFGMEPQINNVKNLVRVLSEYGEVTVRNYQDLKDFVGDFDYIFLSGRFSPWVRKKVSAEFADEIALICAADVPVWGICAGEQIIGLTFGADIIFPGEKKKELGFTEQTICAWHPLLEGFPSLTVFEHHYEQVAPLPDEFELLTTTKNCSVQMMVHKTRPIVATQFHPELVDSEHPDGKKLLDNFFQQY